MASSPLASSVGRGHRPRTFLKRPSDLPAVCLLVVVSSKGNMKDPRACVWDTHKTLPTQIRLVLRDAQYKCVSAGGKAALGRRRTDPQETQLKP